MKITIPSKTLALSLMRAVTAVPVTWFLAHTLASSASVLFAKAPVLLAFTTYLSMPEVLALFTISSAGVVGGVMAMLGSPTGLAVAYVAYVVIISSASPPTLLISALVILGLVLYMPLDVLAKLWRGGLVRVKTSVRGVALTVAFECAKVGVPIFLAWFVYGFYLGIIGAGFSPSPGVSMLWDVFAHTVVGRLLMFMFVVGIGAFLSGSIMDVIASYTTPSILRVRSYATGVINSIKSSLLTPRFPSKFVVSWMAFLASLFLYPFMIVAIRDAVSRYLPWLFRVTHASLPTAAANAVLMIAVLAITYVIMRALLLHLFLAGRGWGSLAVIASITAFLTTYLVMVHHAVPPLAHASKPSPVDREVMSGYYSFYSSLLSILRYVLYLLGVTP